jgi:hypothetical protein
MDPTQNTSPDESALPNVPPQLEAGATSFDMSTVGDVPPPMPQIGQVPPTPPPVSGAAASWLPPTVPVQASDQGMNGGQSSQTSQLNIPAPSIADDGDVIEKEWVDRAKEIVARTRQDPYNQTRELHKFKAEYLQKRYNKTIEAVQE